MAERVFAGVRLGPNDIVIAGPDFTNDRLGDFHYRVELPKLDDVPGREPHWAYLRHRADTLRRTEHGGD